MLFYPQTSLLLFASMDVQTSIDIYSPNFKYDTEFLNVSNVTLHMFKETQEALS